MDETGDLLLDEFLKGAGRFVYRQRRWTTRLGRAFEDSRNSVASGATP